MGNILKMRNALGGSLFLSVSPLSTVTTLISKRERGKGSPVRGNPLNEILEIQNYI